MKSRQEANRLILDRISNAVENNPDLRFHQILQILGVVELNSKFEGSPKMSSSDKFHEESSETWKKMS